MFRYRQPLLVVHGVIGKHNVVIWPRLNQDNVYVGIFQAQAFDMIAHIGIEQGAHRLVDDGLKTTFADVVLSRIMLGGIQRHHGVDADNQLGACFNRQIQACRPVQTPIDIITVVDLYRLVEHGHRAASGDSQADRHCFLFLAGATEDGACASI